MGTTRLGHTQTTGRNPAPPAQTATKIAIARKLPLGRTVHPSTSLRSKNSLTLCVAIVAACGALSSARRSVRGRLPTSTTTETVPAHAPGVAEGPAGTLSVVVKGPTERADSAVRFLRIEDEMGKPVLERSYRTAPAVLSDCLPQGHYRLVSWLRACGGRCQGKEDKDLPAPANICGIRLEFVQNAVASVTVDDPADGECAMTTQR